MSRARNERGAAAVEFALVAPFVLLLLFGTVTTGLTYSDHLSITNAVREGARLGSALPFTPVPPDYPTANPTDWANSVRDRVKQVYFNAGSTVTDSQICVKLESSAGASLAATGTNCTDVPASPTNMSAGSCVVKVWVTKPANIQLIIAPTLNFNIGAKSVSYYGRVGGACTAQ
jgi:Flp pilus assembly pilin Flp